MERERCEACGRFKTRNTGLICTNINCRESISIEQDWAEVYALRSKKSKLNTMTKEELKTECRAKAKELINTFYQPLGKLSCSVNSDTMWAHAKHRALELCKIMLEEHSCYTLNDGRWAYWAQIEIEVNAL